MTGNYLGFDERGKEIPEHVPFHEMLKKQGYRTYINFMLVNCGKPAEKKPQPAMKKVPTSISLGTIKAFRNCNFGKRRFNKYFEMLKNE